MSRIKLALAALLVAYLPAHEALSSEDGASSLRPPLPLKASIAHTSVENMGRRIGYSDYCCMSVDINSVGEVTAVKVLSCSDHRKVQESKRRMKQWLFEPARRGEDRVAVKGLPLVQPFPFFKSGKLQRSRDGRIKRGSDYRTAFTFDRVCPAE